ncbi:MAG: hypothetical protein MZV70_51590 [Desulfobacterales bacterium]|nr:hypothetical protein [Desulfobacterales bacterium]
MSLMYSPFYATDKLYDAVLDRPVAAAGGGLLGCRACRRAAGLEAFDSLRHCARPAAGTWKARATRSRCSAGIAGRRGIPPARRSGRSNPHCLRRAR